MGYAEMTSSYTKGKEKMKKKPKEGKDKGGGSNGRKP